MERIIDLSLRHKDRLMAGRLWLMKIIMLLKLKFFSPFSRDPFNPSTARPFWPPLSNAACDLLHLCFSPFLFQIYFPGAEPTPAAAERVGRSLRGAIAPRPTPFFSRPSYISAGVTSVDVISYGKFLITALFTLRRPRFKSSVRPPLQALCSPLIEPIISPRGSEAAPLL